LDDAAAIQAATVKGVNTQEVNHGERSGVRDDGRPEAGRGQLCLRRQDVRLLFRVLQGDVRPEPGALCEVTSRGRSRQRFILERKVSSAVASALWARFTWSKALFGLLIVNVAWTASLFICPCRPAPLRIKSAARTSSITRTFGRPSRSTRGSSTRSATPNATSCSIAPSG